MTESRDFHSPDKRKKKGGRKLQAVGNCELARISVRSLCHWAVAPTLAWYSSGLAVLGAVASCWKLLARIHVRSLCRWTVAPTLAWFFSGLAVLEPLQAVGNWARADLRSLAVPLGGCDNTCVNFVWARCARGSCKLLETELARICVRSVWQWAVALPLAWFLSGLAVLGAVASCWKLKSREFTFACCAPGRLRQPLRNLFLRLAVLGGCKLSELSSREFTLACSRVGIYGECRDRTCCAWLLGPYRANAPKLRCKRTQLRIKKRDALWRCALKSSSITQ